MTHMRVGVLGAIGRELVPEERRLLPLGEHLDAPAVGERLGKLARSVTLEVGRAFAEPGVDLAERREDGGVARAEGADRLRASAKWA